MNRLLGAFGVAWLLLSVCSGSGCSTSGVGENPMEEALQAVRAGGGSPRERALYGWHLYLVDGDPAKAKATFAAVKDDPVALAGELELARRDLSINDGVRLAIALARVAPTDPLGRLGAHQMVEMVGRSPALDAQLADGAKAVLTQPVSAEVGFLCRLVIARVASLRNAEGWADRYAEVGALREAAVAGPFAGLRQLDFPATYPPQTENALRDKYVTPAGEIRTHALVFPTGDLRLYGSPERGDIFFFASDFQAKGGVYVLHVVSASPFEFDLDGTKVASRAPAVVEPMLQAAPVSLSAGAHRLMIKLSRAEGGAISVFLSRADGQAEDLHFHAASGPSPKAKSVATAAAAPAPAEADPSFPSVPAGAHDLFVTLEPEVGTQVARFLAARDAQSRDLEGSKALINEQASVGASANVGSAPAPAPAPSATASASPDGGGAPSQSALTAPWLMLRAQVLLADHSLPDRTGKGLAGRDLEEVTRRDPAEASAWLVRSYQAREEDRVEDAAAFLAKARAATPRSALVELAESRIQLARGLDATGDEAAAKALELVPGLCEATEIRYDLARRNEALANADRLAQALAACPDGPERVAEHARNRADLAAAEHMLSQRLEIEPVNWRAANDLAQVLVAEKRYAEAQKILATQQGFWPRLAEIHRRLAEVLTLAGDDAGSLAEKRLALSLDGSDLSLRRQLALKEGHDLLDDMAVDGQRAIAEYEASPAPPGSEDSASAYVLDMAGIEAYADGTQVERIHTVAKVLDQRGIPQLAEQHLPAGAIVLRLQTIKKDGRVLEPENISDKEGASLPNVEVGDYVEVEYLATTAPRSLAEPGFASVPFYFRIADTPLFRSTFTFRAPASVPLKVDAHNMKAPDPQKVGDTWVVHQEAHNVPLFISEPGEPGANEFLPMMQVGTGAGPLEGLLPFADSIVSHDLPTLEVSTFAHAAAGEKVGVDAVAAVYAAVMDKVKGEVNDIGDRASTTLARERGSRLWLLKGALRALNITAHVALVRPLASDPSPYLFPNADLYIYPVLLVELPNQPPIWLDPSARYAPFGKLPEQVAGEHEAAVLPAPGEQIRLVKTPPGQPLEPKQVRLHLTLAASGDVVAEGTETYSGFDAAFLRQALEKLDESQRNQAVEVALARSFHGAVLDEMKVVDQPAVGAPMSFRYRFHSPRFARVDGKSLVLATPIFPAALGQRYVAMAARKTPLLINGSEASVSEVRIDLPAGFKLVNAGVAANIASPFGNYKRAVKAEGTQDLVLDEFTEVKSGRVMPPSYDEFVRFAAAVDQAQAQEIDLEQH